MANKNLAAAKKAKNDEFYTQLTDIENELKHYKNHFEGKVVLCNCDDPVESNFFKYFVMNFNHLKLKGLIGIGYAGSPIAYTQLKFSNNDDGELIENTPDKPYVLEVTHLDGDPDAEQFREMVGRKKGKTGYWQVHRLRGDGDFRSEESVSYLKRADIVVTNPPFSLFREYVALLIQYDKKFVIIGNVNAVTYKEFFPLIKDHKVWPGYSFNKTLEMAVPSSYNAQRIGRDGVGYVKVPAIAWYTNLDIAKRHENLILWEKYTPEEYPKYDNYDAINVDKVSEIPCDYEPCWYKCPHAAACKYAQAEGKEDKALCEQACNGEIRVPITYLDKHNPEQHEIVRFRKGDDGSDLVYSADRQFNRISALSFAECRKCNGVVGVPITFLDKYCPEQFKVITMSTMSGRSANYWSLIDGKSKYSRVFVCRKGGR